MFLDCCSLHPCRKDPLLMHLSSYLKKDPGKPPATVFMTLSTHLLYCTVGGLANPNNNLNSPFLFLSSEGFHKKSNSDIVKNFLHSYISEKGVGGNIKITETAALIHMEFMNCIFSPSVQCCSENNHNTEAMGGWRHGYQKWTLS